MRVRVWLLPNPDVRTEPDHSTQRSYIVSLSPDLTANEEVGGWGKNLRIPSSILTSDEEPPLDRGGGTERLRRRVMAAYVATPSHEKTYPSAAPPGTSHT